MKKGTKIKQHDITDCGAACLASVMCTLRTALPGIAHPPICIHRPERYECIRTDRSRQQTGIVR